MCLLSCLDIMPDGLVWMNLSIAWCNGFLITLYLVIWYIEDRNSFLLKRQVKLSNPLTLIISSKSRVSRSLKASITRWSCLVSLCRGDKCLSVSVVKSRPQTAAVFTKTTAANASSKAPGRASYLSVNSAINKLKMFWLIFKASLGTGTSLQLLRVWQVSKYSSTYLTKPSELS